MNKLMSQDPGLIVNSEINFEFFDLAEKDRLRLQTIFKNSGKITEGNDKIIE